MNIKRVKVCVLMRTISYRASSYGNKSHNSEILGSELSHRIILALVVGPFENLAANRELSSGFSSELSRFIILALADGVF
jgi:hypothetical protein